MTTATKAPPAGGILARATRGVRRVPEKLFLYGVEKVGKSTFASNAPAPLFLDVEGGTLKLDVERVEAASYEEALLIVRELLAGGMPDRKTLVLDTADRLEGMIWDHLCRTRLIEGKPAQSIESYGYGKGYTFATEVLRGFLSELDALRNGRGMEIILLAHAGVSTFQNPIGPDYQRYAPLLKDKAAGLLKSWADVVLFATFEDVAAERKGGGVGRGLTTGRRIVRTTRAAAWDAGNRLRLPAEMPLDYATYAAAREAFYLGGLPSERDDARALRLRLWITNGLPLDKRDEAMAWLDKSRGRADALDQLENRLRVVAPGAEPVEAGAESAAADGKDGA